MSASKFDKIDGIGAGYSNKLIGLDVELEDIAAWSDDEIVEMDARLKANGAIVKQDWRGQARKLLGRPPYVPSPAEREAAEQAPDPNAPGAEPAIIIPPPATSPIKPAPTPASDFSAIAASFDPGNPLAGLTAEQTAAIATMIAEAHRFNEKQPAAVPERRKLSAPKLRRLDRNKQYAHITGNHFGAHFSQTIKGETFYFDHEDKEIPWDRDNDVPMPITALQGADFEDEHILSMDEARNIHVLNYLDRKVDYPLALVLRGIKELYGKTLKDEKEARTFLHFIRRTPGL